jgi:hypothetical protein
MKIADPTGLPDRNVIGGQVCESFPAHSDRLCPGWRSMPDVTA